MLGVEEDVPNAEEEAQPKDSGASSTSRKRSLDKERRQPTLSNGQKSALQQLVSVQNPTHALLTVQTHTWKPNTP